MTPWEENVETYPELEEVKAWIDRGNKNDFYQSIIDQAEKRKLSDKQIESVKRSFEKIKNPPKKILFDDLDTIVYSRILDLLSNISPMGSEFYMSIKNQIKSKKELSEKQWAAVTKKFYRFRKSLLRSIFTGSTKK